MQQSGAFWAAAADNVFSRIPEAYIPVIQEELYARLAAVRLGTISPPAPPPLLAVDDRTDPAVIAASLPAVYAASFAWCTGPLRAFLFPPRDAADVCASTAQHDALRDSAAARWAEAVARALALRWAGGAEASKLPADPSGGARALLCESEQSLLLADPTACGPHEAAAVRFARHVAVQALVREAVQGAAGAAAALPAPRVGVFTSEAQTRALPPAVRATLIGAVHPQTGRWRLWTPAAAAAGVGGAPPWVRAAGVAREMARGGLVPALGVAVAETLYEHNVVAPGDSHAAATALMAFAMQLLGEDGDGDGDGDGRGEPRAAPDNAGDDGESVHSLASVHEGSDQGFLLGGGGGADGDESAEGGGGGADGDESVEGEKEVEGMLWGDPVRAALYGAAAFGHSD